MTDASLHAHIQEVHPDKVFSPQKLHEMMEQMVGESSLMLGANIASYLTHLALSKNMSKEQLWEIYSYFFKGVKRLLSG